MKEETYPGAAYKPLFILAPALSFIPALMTMAVIPFGAPWYSRWGVIDMSIAPLPIGFLYILAITSLGVYGIVLAGWSSNNKYALLGGLRSSAQMISYEIAMGMATIPVLLLSGNVSLSAIVAEQTTGQWPLAWNVFGCTLAFFIFFVSAFAETNRLPFDLPEAESELIAGYHSEYSAMKFSMFFIAEYANMVTASALMATLFFGGWDIPFTLWDNYAHSLVASLVTAVFFFVKILIFVFIFMWVRWTLPRFRYDQLMALGWKVLLPLSLDYIVAMAGTIVGLNYAGYYRGSWAFGGDAARAQHRVRRDRVPDSRPRTHREPGLFAARSAQSREAASSGARSHAFCSRGGGRLMAIGVKVLERPIEQTSYVRATLSGMALTLKHLFSGEGDDSVSRGEVGALAALARHAPHAHDRGRQSEVRRLRSLSDRVPGELHQARAG